MRISFGQSAASLSVVRQLNQSGESLSRIFEQLSSGQRINRASDDAAGLAVASGLNVNSRILGQAVRNLSDGTSILNIADQALGQLSSIVTRQLELAEQSSNGVFANSQRAALETEAQALKAEYSRIVASTSFNQISVFDKDLGSLNLQAGVGEDAVLSVEIVKVIPDRLEAFQQTLNTSSPDYQATTLSKVQFLKLVGDDGKDTLLALSVAKNDGTNRLSLVIQSYRVGEDGELEKIAEQVAQSSVAEVSALSASIVADLSGDTLRFNFAVTGGGGFNSTGQLKVGTDGALSAIGASIGPVGNQSGSSITGDFTGLGQSESVENTGGKAEGLQLLDINANLFSVVEGDADPLSQANFSVATQGQALLALETLKGDLENINQSRARVGAALSRVEVASRVLEVSKEQSTAAESRIMDADIAASSAELVRQTILQQSAVAVLAQANVQPELALSLLVGI